MRRRSFLGLVAGVAALRETLDAPAFGGELKEVEMIVRGMT